MPKKINHLTWTSITGKTSQRKGQLREDSKNEYDLATKKIGGGVFEAEGAEWMDEDLETREWKSVWELKGAQWVYSSEHKLDRKRAEAAELAGARV